jgi:hypothetical protein
MLTVILCRRRKRERAVAHFEVEVNPQPFILGVIGGSF